MPGDTSQRAYTLPRRLRRRDDTCAPRGQITHVQPQQAVIAARLSSSLLSQN